MRGSRFHFLHAIIVTIALVLGSVPAYGATAKQKSRASKKSSARKPAAKKSSQKARGRSSRATAKSKRGRTTKRGVVARGRGRSRWNKRAVRSAPVYYRSGIHNFLTSAWVNSQNAALTPPVASEANAAASAADASRPRTYAGTEPSRFITDPVLGTIPVNPLVFAYTSSLAARGFRPSGQGFIVETLDGEVLAEHNADELFNPASVVKVATSLTAISKLGPDFRFRTSIYTDGVLDEATQTLKGSIYLVGSGDPAFFYENAMLIADQLNRHGIRTVEGNLVVLGNFYFNLSASREASAKAFRGALTPETWNAGCKAAYPRFLAMRSQEDRKPVATTAYTANNTPYPVGAPSLKITGETITNSAVDTRNLRLLAVHTSLPLVLVLKGLNDFSNNWMAHVIGNMVGGPDAVARFLKTEVGLPDDEANIVTSSGLGSNAISPRGTIHILRKLIAFLQKEGLGIEHILPVAGVDQGTLERRFTDAYRGSVVAKTGTLRSVSALAGVAYTRSKGPLLFVIYNRGGSPATFRAVQDETIRKLIQFYGGPAPVRYVPNQTPRLSGDHREADSETEEGAALIAPWD